MGLGTRESRARVRGRALGMGQERTVRGVREEDLCLHSHALGILVIGPVPLLHAIPGSILIPVACILPLG